ncbi:hypothetical protein GQ53DRAFT_831921 [Thozetella sp. PMI_491]|nr:hypothetical protein GQ53DRAFT_831921 [Thozetella sp. PMI_491]
MSFLDSDTTSRTWLPILGILEEDSYRSRNTLAYTRSAHVARHFSESTFVRELGHGAVFDVTLRQHAHGLFAVKRAKTRDQWLGSTGAAHNNGILVALKEVQVVSHHALRDHSNIVDILGWDWDAANMPVLFTEYAELGTLKDFIRVNPDLSLCQRGELALDVACGLNALHSTDIAHGDVKLANTLVFPRKGQDGTCPWMAKASDFSHAVFGISSRRITTYPGSSLYNAPEVRRRNALIPSDRLTRCEAFSFGLLAWELLKSGDTYFDSNWSRRSSSDGTSGPSYDELLLQLPRNELKESAIKYIHSRYHPLSTEDKLAFAKFLQLFEMSLRDDPAQRRDMLSIAIFLDSTGDADILLHTTNISLRSINVWDFNVHDNEPWSSKALFVSDLRGLLAGPVQPNHAEIHLLLCRCYAEGYGVFPSRTSAIHHLREAAIAGSLDAAWTWELNRWGFARTGFQHDRHWHPDFVTRTARSIVTNITKLRQERHHHDKKLDAFFSLTACVHQWNQRNANFVATSGFTAQISRSTTRYQWDTSRKDRGVPSAQISGHATEYQLDTRREAQDILAAQIGESTTKDQRDTERGVQYILDAELGGSVTRYRWDNEREAEGILDAEIQGSATNYRWDTEREARDGLTAFASEAAAADKPLCDVVVTYATLLSPTNTSTFFEAWAIMGMFPWASVRHLMPSADDFSASSYSSQGEFYLRLLTMAAKGGHYQLILDIIDHIEVLKSVNDEAINLESATGESPLHHFSCMDEDTEHLARAVQGLVRLGLSIDEPVTARSWIAPHGIELFGTPLQMAVRFRNYHAVVALVENGADISAGYLDTPCPLSLATSFHCSFIVEYLLGKDGCAKKPRQIIKMVAVPTRRGWFERLISDLPTQVPGDSLIDTICEYLFRFSADTSESYWNPYFVELDGSPLIEAVERGQRDFNVLASLIELGLAPRTYASRWRLIKTVLQMPRDDPLRLRLFTLLLRRRDIGQTGYCGAIMDNDLLHTSNWCQAWPDFFTDFRGSDPEEAGLSILHILVKWEDFDAIRCLLSIFPHLSSALRMSAQHDSGGMTPMASARSKGLRDIVLLLQRNVWTCGRQTEWTYRGRFLRNVSQTHISNEQNQLRDIPRLLQRPYRSRYLEQFRAGVGLPHNFQPHLENTTSGPEETAEARHARRKIEINISELLGQRDRSTAVATELERLAYFTLENDNTPVGVCKAEDLFITADIMKAVANKALGSKRDRSFPSAWAIPLPFRVIYCPNDGADLAAERMARAYVRLMSSEPSWMPRAEEQNYSSGPLAILEWFKDSWFQSFAESQAKEERDMEYRHWRQWISAI